MSLENKTKLFVKSSNIKNITIPVLFIFTFLLFFFNKTEYILINKIKSSGIDYISPISKIVSYPVTFTIKTVDLINDLRLTKMENIKLKQEIIRLKKWQVLALKNSSENNAYRKLLNSTSNDLYVVKTAGVIHYSPGLYSRSIVVNAGFADQVVKDSAVINERGLVGKAVLVTKNNTKVLLINDQNFSVSVKSYNRDFHAIMKGSSDGKFLNSSFIKDNSIPLVGDILITSGTAGIYPKNILVAKVISVLDEKVIALPFVDTKNIEFVQIVKNN